MEKSNLWYRVLRAKYGEDGELVGNGRRGSNWWRDMWFVEKGEGIKERQLSKAIRKVVGNGVNTSFWGDAWVEGGLLKNRFHKLFLLTQNKEEFVRR